jgi:uncharacterized protein YyaL (SSP411 family)
MKDNSKKDVVGQNRLKGQKSPYLLQHAENPVHWYPWGDEAFSKAVGEDKPIFLSIGYSTCHWCHVMAHESFEDLEVAQLLNHVFVSIKVDREERPDIDNIYMRVCQMMTGSGGWPLTILMTPDKKPFYAGTYFPKVSSLGRIGMLDLVPEVERLWKEKRDEIHRTAQKVLTSLKESARVHFGIGTVPDASLLERAYRSLCVSYDPHFGGFGTSPKFPSPSNMLFLLRYAQRNGDGKAVEMVDNTLGRLRKGGIYDHVGFGFHRYATDREWKVPHFEKMLYDQALLFMVYTEAYQVTEKEEYRETVDQIFSYVTRNLSSPEGGFYSAEDADSEGEEGKFYLWSYDEVEQLLDRSDAQFLEEVFHLRRDGNYLDEASRSKNGKNILFRHRTDAEISDYLGLTADQVSEKLNEIRHKLFVKREERVHPQRDDKILTDWNGLMIASLARGFQVFGKEQYVKASRKACSFILEKMVNKQGELQHRYREGDAAIPAYLNDYASFVLGLIELYQSDFNAEYLERGVKLLGFLIEHFWDGEEGLFFTSADNAERILIRNKETYDGAVPSGNAMALLVLLKLGHMTGEPKYLQYADKLLCTIAASLEKHPQAYTFFLTALDFYIGPSHEVVITGNPNSADTKKMLEAIRRPYFPNMVVLFRPANGKNSPITRLAPFTEQQNMLRNRATCYVCSDFTCNMPTNSIGDVLQLLNT